MRWKIRKCINCGAYTLQEICPYCGNKTKIPHPPRFSPVDKYGKYRRLLKLEAEIYYLEKDLEQSNSENNRQK